MKKTTSALVSILGLVFLVPPIAGAAPTMFGDNGHYYEVIVHEEIGWHAAKTAAEGMTFIDPATLIEYNGHLVIITTSGEDTFVDNLRSQALVANPHVTRREFWAGAKQDPDPGLTDASANWNWINPEAPFNNYTNWLSGEPNDFNETDEMFLGVGHGGHFGWNDEASLGNIGGYIVEYDVDAVVFEGEDLDECFEGAMGEGCPTTLDGAQMVSIPDTAVLGQNPSLSATTFRLTDDPQRCGKAPLVLFDGDLIISPNHCATEEAGYEFLVVFTETEDIIVQEGVIQVIQDAQAALPLFPYTCDQPIALSTSPNNQEVVIYQRTNKEDMREFGETWGPFFDQFDELGGTSDITDSCGSSRARRAENSYSVIGMVQRFDEISDFDDYPEMNFIRWNELAHFKLELLIEAIEASEPALSPFAYYVIKRQADVALRKFERGRYRRAEIRLGILLWWAERVTYNSTDNNDQGEAIERAASTKFMIKEKIRRFR